VKLLLVCEVLENMEEASVGHGKLDKDIVKEHSGTSQEGTSTVELGL
jgi:hypothetical protein